MEAASEIPPDAGLLRSAVEKNKQAPPSNTYGGPRVDLLADWFPLTRRVPCSSQAVPKACLRRVATEVEPGEFPPRKSRKEAHRWPLCLCVAAGQDRGALSQGPPQRTRIKPLLVIAADPRTSATAPEPSSHGLADEDGRGTSPVRASERPPELRIMSCLQAAGSVTWRMPDSD